MLLLLDKKQENIVIKKGKYYIFYCEIFVAIANNIVFVSYLMASRASLIDSTNRENLLQRCHWLLLSDSLSDAEQITRRLLAPLAVNTGRRI
jgi:hypothetical protein